MWFKFPPGTSEISIERQNYRPEATDELGGTYFRAPNHFAPTLLSLKGFKAENPPEGSIKDLPQEIPEKDNTIEVLSQKNSQLAVIIEGLNTDKSAMNAKLSALLAERDDLKIKLHESQTELANLKNDIEDGEVVVKGGKK